MKSFRNNEEKTRDALNYFRTEVKKARFPGLHIQCAQGRGSVVYKKEADNLKTMGINSVAMYIIGGRSIEDYIVFFKKSYCIIRYVRNC